MHGSMNQATRDALARMAGRRPTVTIAQGGALLKMQCPPGLLPQVGGAKRGSIVSYTRQSRKRLLEYFNSLDRSKVEETPLFLTLTYPEQFPTDIAQSKAHLFAFVKRITRRYRDAAMVWRLEWQVRGAPHYHVLLFNVPFLPHQDVAAWWSDTVNSGDARHLAAGTRVERIRGWTGVIFYASKYLGKLGDVPANVKPGRLWGVCNRRNMPRTLLVQEVAWQSFYALRRTLWLRGDNQGVPHGRKARFVGMTVFLPTSDATRLFRQAVAVQPHTL